MFPGPQKRMKGTLDPLFLTDLHQRPWTALGTATFQMPLCSEELEILQWVALGMPRYQSEWARQGRLMHTVSLLGGHLSVAFLLSHA